MRPAGRPPFPSPRGSSSRSASPAARRRQAVDRGLEITGDRVGDRVPDTTGQGATTATTRNSLRILARAIPAACMSIPAPMPSGRLETKIATNKRHADRFPSREADAEDGLLWDAVEKGTERKARSGPPPPCRARPCRAREQAVGDEVGQRPERKPGGDRRGAADLIASSASSKLTALISAPAPKARIRPISAGDQLRAKASSTPITNDDAARAPHPKAGPHLRSPPCARCHVCDALTRVARVRAPHVTDADALVCALRLVQESAGMTP